MPDAVRQGRRVVEGRECMASDRGLESVEPARMCKRMEHHYHESIGRRNTGMKKKFQS